MNKTHSFPSRLERQAKRKKVRQSSQVELRRVADLLAELLETRSLKKSIRLSSTALLSLNGPRYSSRFAAPSLRDRRGAWVRRSNSRS